MRAQTGQQAEDSAGHGQVAHSHGKEKRSASALGKRCEAGNCRSREPTVGHSRGIGEADRIQARIRDGK
jgi:hypothetical protein